MKPLKNFVEPNHQIFNECLRAFLPLRTYVPFIQNDRTEYECGVSPGDTVREGQIIAGPKDVLSVFGANIHSPVSGTVEEIVQCTLPDGHLGKAAKIKTGGKFEYMGKKLPETDWTSYSPETILDIFKTKGVVNSFGKKAYSLSSQIKSISLRENRFLVVRMFDEDPGRVTDSYVAKVHTEKVCKGASIIAKAMHSDGIVFVLPKKAEFQIPEEIMENVPHCSVIADNSRYPSGLMNSILKILRKKAKTEEGPDYSKANHKCLFIDPETALSAYESVVLGLPVIERFININGNCLKSVGMIKARIGTPLSDLVEQCGGFKKEPAKIVVNGMILGHSISRLDIPVTKEIKSVTFLNTIEVSDQTALHCIRCGKCRAICPEELTPDLLYRNVTEKYYVPKDLLATATLCANCNLCNSVCPSRLSLSQTISIIRNSK